MQAGVSKVQCRPGFQVDQTIGLAIEDQPFSFTDCQAFLVSHRLRWEKSEHGVDRIDHLVVNAANHIKILDDQLTNL